MPDLKLVVQLILEHDASGSLALPDETRTNPVANIALECPTVVFDELLGHLLERFLVEWSASLLATSVHPRDENRST